MKRFRTDVGLMLGSRVGVVVVGVVQSVVLARALGPDGRGAVAAGVALLLILMQVGTLGLVTANPYLVARAPDLREALTRNSLWLAAGLGLLLAAVGAGVAVLAPSAVTGLGTLQVALALASVPGAIAASLLQSLLLGQGRTVAYNALGFVTALVPVVAVVTWEIAAGLTVTAALALVCGAWYFSALVFLLALRVPAPAAPDRALARRALAYGLRVAPAALLGFLLIRLDMLFVNGFRGPADAGVYAVAVALADGLYLIPTSIAFNVFARVARGDGRDLTDRVFRLTAVWFAGVCVIAAVLSGPAIRLLFGVEFDGATHLFWWLAPGAWALGLLSILSQHYAGEGYPVVLIWSWLGGLALNVALNVAFLGSGLWVAPMASTVAYALVLAVHARRFFSEGAAAGT